MGDQDNEPKTPQGRPETGSGASEPAPAAAGPDDAVDPRLSLAAKGDAPAWLPEASDENRWEQIYGAVETDAAARSAESGDAAIGDAESGDAAKPEAAPAEAGVPGPESGLTPTPTPAYQPAAPAETETKGRPLFGGLRPIVWIGAAVVVGLILITVIIANVLNRPGQEPAAAPSTSGIATASPGADGVIAEDVSPLDFERGQCFIDFEGVTQNATVVSCTTPHAAQLVGTFFYPEGDQFPGRDALNVKASEFCKDLALSPAMSSYQNLSRLYVFPSEGTWQAGDRRIDCFVQSKDGNVITVSLMPE